MKKALHSSQGLGMACLLPTLALPRSGSVGHRCPSQPASPQAPVSHAIVAQGARSATGTHDIVSGVTTSSAATSRLTKRSAQSSLRGYARGATSPHHTREPSITTTSSGSPPLASRTSQPRSGRVTRYQISRTPYDSCRSPVHRTVFVLCTGRRCYNHGRTAYEQSRTGGAAIDEGSQPWQYVPAPQRKTPAACSVPE